MTETYAYPDNKGHFGMYGGRYVPETLMQAVTELEAAYKKAQKDAAFHEDLNKLLKDYVGRETPLYFAENLTKYAGGAKIYLKREDLNHTGAHKINNSLGQALLAKRMGKKKVVAETGAGQHGVATATACALLNLECTLKDACNEALRYWVTNVVDTHYILGSVMGPHPFPMMVRDFQSVIGIEAKKQYIEKVGNLPEAIVACIGGGSNAMGIFYPFIEDESVALYGVEASGHGLHTDKHAASLSKGKPGVLHGSYMYLLQNEDGQIQEAHSISAGLDYPGIGPEHSFLHDIGRATYESVTDDEAFEALQLLCKVEGIIPALESAHAISYAVKLAAKMNKEEGIIVCLSGRGDKDVNTVMERMEE